MAMKIPEGDSTAMNMTPMIDIVFNLVTFFMLTLDLSHKELAVLDLPRANSGREDKDPKTDKNAKPEEKSRFIINLQADGSLYFKGNTWKLAQADPKEQDIALENLRIELRKLVANVAKEPDTGASKAMVLVRGDRQAKWKYVQWIMQVCADPQIKIYKLHFAVEHPKKE
jgi:biopolymer transport protein ExbD